MNPTRRLAAILAADLAGYSRLVGADEEGTLARLKAHRATPRFSSSQSHSRHCTDKGEDYRRMSSRQVCRSSAFLFSEAIRASMPLVRSIKENSERRVATSLIALSR
jgi:hypothetical protein